MLRALVLDSDDIGAFRPDQEFIDALKYDRRSERYEEAIELAWLIIRNHAPELMSGESPVLAMVFDMNSLYERTVVNLLQREARAAPNGIAVKPKASIRFWNSHHLIPDILLIRGNEIVIVDTKWKTDSNDNLSEHDLRQVFVYGIYFNASRVILLFPKTNGKAEIDGRFEQARAIEDFSLSCSIMYADLVAQDGTLNNCFAKDFLSKAFMPATEKIRQL